MWPTHCHLMPRLWMSGTIFPLQPYAFMVSTGTTAPSYTQMLHYNALGYRVCTDSAPWFRTHNSALFYRSYWQCTAIWKILQICCRTVLELYLCGQWCAPCSVDCTHIPKEPTVSTFRIWQTVPPQCQHITPCYVVWHSYRLHIHCSLNLNLRLQTARASSGLNVVAAYSVSSMICFSH